MPSTALDQWRTIRAGALDELEQAHASVGGSGPGRRYATQQINQAYAVLLSSHFQGYCRDLHTEYVEHMVESLGTINWRATLLGEFTRARKLDTGNANPGNIGADFNRLGIEFWKAVLGRDPKHGARRDQLEELNKWRNAIAHQAFDPQQIGNPVLHVARVRQWRKVCERLAFEFDAVMREHLRSLLGAAPW
jgi:hypothetical protein